MVSNKRRDATLLRLMSEAEALLSQSEPLDHGQAARVVELLAKMREADVRGQAELRRGLDLMRVQVEELDQHLTAKLNRDEALAARVHDLVTLLEALRGEQVVQIERAEANRRRIDELWKSVDGLHADNAAKLARDEAQARKIELLQGGFDGLHADNVAKLARDEALVQCVQAITKQINVLVTTDNRSQGVVDTIKALRESGARARLMQALSSSASGARDRRAVFTLHRCASMLVWRIMEYIANVVGVQLHSPNGAGSEYIMDEVRLREKGDIVPRHFGLLGPFRGYFEFDADTFSRCVLVLRDPRDLLVSMYYSWTHSHPIGEEAMLVGPDGELLRASESMRQQWIEQGPDTFVLQYAGFVEGNLRRYFDAILPLRSTTLLTYENLMLDPRTWVFSFMCGLGASNVDADEFTSFAMSYFAREFDPVVENPNVHRRQMRPGDHLRKLKQETIDALTRRFQFYFDAIEPARTEPESWTKPGLIA